MTTTPTGATPSQPIVVPPGAESPVLWGSIAGVLVSAGIAFATFLSNSSASSSDEAWIVAAFACVVGVRYYTSVVFLTYDDYLSPKIEACSAGARQGIFVSQFVLVLGSSLNISLLTTLGAVASASVILLQAASTVLYWKPLWKPLTKGPDGRFRMFMVLGEVAVAACALHILLRLTGLTTSVQGESMLLGAVIMLFITECVTTYTESVTAFFQRTRAYLSDGKPGSSA